MVMDRWEGGIMAVTPSTGAELDLPPHLLAELDASGLKGDMRDALAYALYTVWCMSDWPEDLRQQLYRHMDLMVRLVQSGSPVRPRFTARDAEHMLIKYRPGIRLVLG